MWIYFNKQGNLTAKIPHGEIIRQNSTFNFYIAIDKEYFREFFNTSIKPFESYTLEQLVNKINETFEASLTILGVDISTSLTMEIKEFYKIKSTEITYNFEHGKQYLTYHYFGDHNLLTSSGTHEATLQLESKNNDIVKMLGNISFYVEKTYNTENNNINNGTIGGGGNGGNYELPIATPTILGGIKVGEGLNIGATGHLSVSEIYPTREEINDNFLAKDGGDLSGPLKVESNGNSQFISTSQDTAISVKGSSPNSYIKFVGSNGDLGYIGVNSEKKPVFYDTKDKRIILDEDLENALKDYLAKDGGVMSGPLVITGGDAATGAGNIQLDTNGHILAKGTTSTLLGRHDEGSTLLVGHNSHDLKLRGSSTVPTYNDNNIALEKDIYKREELETYVSGVAENYISKDAVEIGSPANKVKFYGSLYEDEDTAIVNFDNKLGTFLGYEYKPTTIKSSSTLKWEDGNGNSNTIIDSSNIGSYAVSLDGDHNKQIRIRASIVPESGYSGLKLGETGHEFMSVYADDFYGTLHGTADFAQHSSTSDTATTANYAGQANKDDQDNIIHTTYLNATAVGDKQLNGGIVPEKTNTGYIGSRDKRFAHMWSDRFVGDVYKDAVVPILQHKYDDTVNPSDSVHLGMSEGVTYIHSNNDLYHKRKDISEPARILDTHNIGGYSLSLLGTDGLQGNIIPQYRSKYNLGSADKAFNNVYSDYFHGDLNGTANFAQHSSTSDTATTANYAGKANKDDQDNIIHTTYLNAASSGNKTFAGILLPSADNSGAIGHANTKFSQIYATNFYGTFNAGIGVQLLGRTSDLHTLLGNSSYKTYISSSGELYHRNANTNKDVRILDAENIGGYSLSLSGTDGLQGNIIPQYRSKYNLGSADKAFNNVYSDYFHGDLNGTANFAQHSSTSDTATTANYAGKANKDDQDNIIHTTYLKKSGGSISDEIYPGTDSSIDLGTNYLKFQNVYANNFKGNADSATKATNDSDNKPINTTYWKKDDLVFSFNSYTGVLSITKK